MIHAFTVAAFLCALVSRVALTLEGAFCIDAVAISTQPDVLTLINVCLGKGKTCIMFKFAEHMLLSDFEYLLSSSAPKQPLNHSWSNLVQAKPCKYMTSITYHCNLCCLKMGGNPHCTSSDKYQGGSHSAR